MMADDRIQQLHKSPPKQYGFSIGGAGIASGSSDRCTFN